MIATIILQNVELYAFHGCYEQEQRVGNRFRVDLTLQYDATIAAQTDDVQHTVNYLKVYECLREQMMETSHILEHVAARILDKLGAEFSQIICAEVSIAKLAPPLGGQLQGVSLVMKRNYIEA